MDAIGAQMGAHALFNAYKGGVGIQERNRAVENAVMRLRVGALADQVHHYKSMASTNQVTLFPASRA